MKTFGRNKGGENGTITGDTAAHGFVHGAAMVEKDRLPVGMIQTTGRTIPKQLQTPQSQTKTQMFRGK